MAYVVIRRFRNGEGSSTRSFRQEHAAEAAARAWCEEGWEVEIIPTGGRGVRRILRAPDQPEIRHPTPRLVDTPG